MAFFHSGGASRGPTGPQGPTGPPGPPGSGVINWLGSWSAATNYQVNDAVVSGGTSYICILQHTNQVPPNATYWNVLASKGDSGVQGIQGIQGVQGPQGIQGATGPQGPQGPTGLQGATGAQGPIGATGAAGPAGAAGEKGLNWQGTWDSATAYVIDDAVVRNGTSYIAIANNTNSEPPSSNWETLAAKGEQGPQGAQGPAGVTGAQGLQGIQGPEGPEGPEGPQGPTGATGPQGLTGAEGPAGDVGAPGPTVDWKGGWNSLASYVVNDAVSHEGSSYLCIGDSTNNEPPDAAFWQLIASKGDAGDAGPAGPAAMPVGLVGTPGLPFTGDANTGFYQPATDTIGFVTNGAERMRFDANGNLLIATTSAPTTMAKGIAIGQGTAPTASPTDGFAMWVQDRNATAGKAALHYRSESGIRGIIGDRVGFGVTVPLGALHVNPPEGGSTAFVNVGDDFKLNAGSSQIVGDTGGWNNAVHVIGVTGLSAATRNTDGLMLCSQWGASTDFAGALKIHSQSGVGAFSFYAGTSAATPGLQFHINRVGNVGIGTSTFGTSAGRNLTILNGTAPTVDVADQFHLYAFDQAAGNSCPHFRTENGSTIKLYKTNTYTQNFTTADRTINAYTTDAESVAYTGIATGEAATPYAQVTDLNALRTAYENLRASYDDLLAAFTALVDDLQSTGLIG